MNILMVTNTFTPHVGGVARSVQSYADAFRRLGHRVLIVAPHFDGTPLQEEDVLRFPALEHFHHSDFSVPLPAPVGLHRRLDDFAPEVVHAHHPFLLGHTALRTAAERCLPIVFTHHTMYERYTHYLPVDSERVRRFAVRLAVGYCNLCDAVVAPSTTLAGCLRRRGVVRPIEVIPTGIDPKPFAQADGAAFRRRIGVFEGDFLFGYLGRLSPEKNLPFLAQAVAAFMKTRPDVRFLLVGEGPARDGVRKIFADHGLTARVHLVGILDRAALAAAYCAMDGFVFASQSETQGMVLAEAMAAGTPVVAVSAPGVRDIVKDKVNGRLLATEDTDAFVAALAWLRSLSPSERAGLRQGALATAEAFSMPRSAERMLRLYARLIAEQKPASDHRSRWTMACNRMEEEWKILNHITRALMEALRPEAGLRQPRESSE